VKASEAAAFLRHGKIKGARALNTCRGDLLILDVPAQDLETDLAEPCLSYTCMRWEAQIRDRSGTGSNRVILPILPLRSSRSLHRLTALAVDTLTALGWH